MVYKENFNGWKPIKNCNAAQYMGQEWTYGQYIYMYI